MKIDYDVGDLVEVVHDFFNLQSKTVYVCMRLCVGVSDTYGPNTLAADVGVPNGHGYSFWPARVFRKLPKKSQEFFTGEYQDTPSAVDA